MNVDLLTIAGVLAALAVVPWIHIGKGGGRDDGWAPRFTAWMLALSAAAFTLAIPQWRDTLAAFTAGKGGLGVLTVVLFVSGLCFWLQAIHRRKDAGSGGRFSFLKKKNAPAPALKPRHTRHHYDRVYTMVVSAAFGTAAVLAWVRGGQLIAEVVKSPARAQVALGQYSQAVHDGSAVHALTPAQQHHYELIAGAIAIAIALFFRGHERRRHGKPFLLPGKKAAKSTGGGGGGQRAVGGGGQRAIGG
jgi:hypothetical protein